jgi:hypothetical protein
MGKGGRGVQHHDREVDEMPIAITVAVLTVYTVVGHWNAGYAERRTSGVGRSGQKRTGNGTSLAAYSTRAWCNCK